MYLKLNSYIYDREIILNPLKHSDVPTTVICCTCVTSTYLHVVA